MAEEELKSYLLQLQQVEAALLGDPGNDELLKLKADLDEIITLQRELVNASAGGGDSSEGVAAAPAAPAIQYKVGDRVMAPTPNGHKGVAIVESISSAGYAITFINSGQKTIVDPSDLSEAPGGPAKKYVFDKDSRPRSGGANKKEWQEEREKRRLKAQKKEMKKKELEVAKETEKSNWLKFNNKAAKKGLQGMKRVSATGSSADTVGRKSETVSSRNNQFAFKSARGNMDSLF